ncbi:MAG: transposase [Akkermansia sp.]|nr:transposase [Akkermansia sp.]
MDNPDIPIDCNTAERAVRPVTVGRKNCLFIGAPEAGQRSAILYTMMEECKRCKVDGLAWLTWVLGKLPGYRGDMEELMPAAMPKAEEEVKTAQI